MNILLILKETHIFFLSLTRWKISWVVFLSVALLK